MSERRIGGTDISKLTGHSPYGGPLDVYRRIVEGWSPEENAPMRMGKLLEPVVRAEYIHETGAVMVADRPRVHLSEAHPFASGSFDDLRADCAMGVEYKTARLSIREQWGEPGTDIVPPPYLLQAAWYMALSGLPEWDLAVLIAADEFRCYRLKRDTELEGHLLEVAAKFWRDHIVPKRPPSPDATETYQDWLSEKFPAERTPLRPATAEEAQLVADLHSAEDQAEALATRVNELRNCLRASIGEAEGLAGAGFRVTWRKAKDSKRTDWKAVAAEAEAPKALIEKHTETAPGSRRLLVRYTQGDT